MRCNMGVGCDETGACYALANGQPQLCPSGTGMIPWVQAVDDALICWHIGVAGIDDDYDTARQKLSKLIQIETQAACDPCVNGGKVLVNKEELLSLLRYFAKTDMPDGVRECLTHTMGELL